MGNFDVSANLGNSYYLWDGELGLQNLRRGVGGGGGGGGGGGEAVNSSRYKKGMGGKCYAEMKLSKA